MQAASKWAVLRVAWYACCEALEKRSPSTLLRGFHAKLRNGESFVGLCVRLCMIILRSNEPLARTFT